MGRLKLSKLKEAEVVIRRRMNAIRRVDRRIKGFSSHDTNHKIQMTRLCHGLVIQNSDLKAELKKVQGFLEASKELLHRPPMHREPSR